MDILSNSRSLELLDLNVHDRPPQSADNMSSTLAMTVLPPYIRLKILVLSMDKMPGIQRPSSSVPQSFRSRVFTLNVTGKVYPLIS